MNKQDYMRKVEELKFALAEEKKAHEHTKSEFGRLKDAYTMSEKLIGELQAQEPSPFLPSVEEIKPFLHWAFHKADKIYMENVLGWRKEAIEEMYVAYKGRKK